MQSPERDVTSGISLASLARVALLATVFGRGVAPAIPGLAVGIAPFISMSAKLAAFLTQLVAAGGVAAAVLLAAHALRLPKLDLGYRLIALPAAAIVVLLVADAWARPLEPELSRMMALAAIAASLAAAVASLRLIDTRASGLVLAAASMSALSHLIARELVSRAAERLDASTANWAVAVATLATLLDLTALGLGLAFIGRKQPRRSLIVAAAVILPAVLIGIFAAHGTAPGVGITRVLTERVLAQLSRAPAAALPPAIRFAVTAALLIGTGLSLGIPSERSKTSVVFALCLLSLGAPDIPLPALWLVVASLLAPKHAELPPLKHEESGSAPPATG